MRRAQAGGDGVTAESRLRWAQRTKPTLARVAARGIEGQTRWWAHAVRRPLHRVQGYARRRLLSAGLWSDARPIAALLCAKVTGASGSGANGGDGVWVGQGWDLGCGGRDLLTTPLHWSLLSLISDGKLELEPTIL